MKKVSVKYKSSDRLNLITKILIKSNRVRFERWSGRSSREESKRSKRDVRKG
jgi:hypothetical protein